MIKTKKWIIGLLLILNIIPLIIPAALANSAEPPGLVILVNMPPEDLKIKVVFSDGSTAETVEMMKTQKAWEAYYRFFYHTAEKRLDVSFEGAVLEVSSAEKSFVLPLPEYTFSQYNNLLTLDFKNETVTIGQSPYRTALLIALRMFLTLLIEGAVLFLFGYRKIKSIIIFIVINLLTQGALNIALTGPVLGSYWFFGFIVFEALIFIAEALVFAVILREHSKKRAVLFAISANLLSLVAGGLIISYLPV